MNTNNIEVLPWEFMLKISAEVESWPDWKKEGSIVFDKEKAIELGMIPGERK